MELDLREEIIRLGPWHLDVEVTPEMSTRVFLEAPPETYPDLGRVQFQSPRERWMENMRFIYPEGLQGRTVLDCACNCGAYLFWAKELGAGDCFGFDAREHWITQARFLQRHRSGPNSGIQFEICDLYDVPKLGLEPFDITLFNGLFYHLYDPIGGLRIACDLTKELIHVGTATRKGMQDGLLVVDAENPDWAMSGLHNLRWLPTGPGAIEPILRWAGFEETAVASWWEKKEQAFGRVQVVGSRTPGLLSGF